MLSPDQIHTVLEILNRRVLMFIGTTIGESGLSDQDKKILKDYGVDYKKLYDESKDIVTLNFHLGMLSNILGSRETDKLSYNDLVKYIKSGDYIPLNNREKATINSIKMQSLADIRANQGKIFQDINNVVNKEFHDVRANQEEFLREKIEEGISKRKNRRTIAREIAKLTGDWARNFDKSVQYISHTALNEGRAAMIEKRYGNNEEAKIYFLVQKDACDHCKKAYLQNGNEPKIFSLKELQANGSNIGRKAVDWLPTLHALHVNCRCLATEYIEGQEWNGSRFVYPEEYESKIKRPKIRVSFNGKDYLV